MNSLIQIWEITIYNFRKWYRNPAIIATFFLAFIFCFLLSDKFVQFSYQQGTTIQIVEAFIWTFADSNSILLITVLLLLLFYDIPFLNSGSPFYLMRTKRHIWLISQVLYIILATLIFLSFILISTIILNLKNAFIGNKWSETSAILGYSAVEQSITIPVSVKTLEMTTPYKCVIIIVVLVLLYSLFIMFITLAINLHKGQLMSVIVVLVICLYGFLLNPKVFNQILRLKPEQQYIANLWAAWLSPLQHATFEMHNFGFDNLPSLSISFLMFAVFIIACFFIALIGMRKYNFHFRGSDIDNE